MSTYKLYCLNGRGRAEVSRLIFAVAGQKYEDIRYEREEFASHKSEMPLAGKDNLEQAQVDAVVDTAQDFMMAFVPCFQEQDPVKKQELIKKFLSEDSPKHVHNLEVLNKLYGNGGSFFVGNKLTWADLFVYSLLDYIVNLDENWLDNNPWIKQNRAEVEKQPKIAEYLKNRPKSAY